LISTDAKGIHQILVIMQLFVNRKKKCPLGLISLPLEVLANIFSDAELSQADRKALRLTCRCLNLPARTALFRRIVLSSLYSDRDAFLSVAATPHLAVHVRELVWHETPDESSLGYIGLIEDDDIPNLIQEQCRKLYWLQSLPDDHAEESEAWLRRERIIGNFQIEFAEALAKMPGLCSFVSHSMPAERIVASLQGYPVPAYLLQAHVRDRHRVKYDGFFRVLLPYIARPESRIRKLVWDDDNQQSIMRRFSAPPSKTISLTSIAFTFPFGRIDEEGLTNVGSFLRSAVDLQELAIYFIDAGDSDRLWVRAEDSDEDSVTASIDQDWSDSPSDVSKPLLGYAYRPGDQPAWPHLRSLSLAIPIALEDLLSLIRPHAPSLHCISLENHQVSLSFIQKLSDIPLKEIRAISDELEPQYCEQSLLRLLTDGRFRHKMEGTLFGDPLISHKREWPNQDEDNGSDAESVDSQDLRQMTAPRWKWGRFSHQDDTTIYCWSVPPGETGGNPTKTWCFIHRNGTVCRGVEPLEYFEDRDSSAGDIAVPIPYCNALVDFLYDDLDCDNCDCDCGDCVESTLGGTVGLLSRIQRPEGAIKYVDKDNRTCNQHKNSATHNTAPVDSQDIYRTAPRWKWGCFFHQDDFEVYYWCVPPGEAGGKPTQVWRFIHHNGTVCYGAEPHDCFDNWDSSAGDVAEPTPFCTALREFIEEDMCRCDGCDCIERVLGSAVDFLYLIQPPEGSVKYVAKMGPLNYLSEGGSVKYVDEMDPMNDPSGRSDAIQVKNRSTLFLKPIRKLFRSFSEVWKPHHRH
jgi:hypothetical protein